VTAVDIIGMGAEKLDSTITGVEMFRKILDRGEAGDNVGILLRGIEKTDIKRGMVIVSQARLLHMPSSKLRYTF
jgi:elongation factor Tu